MHKLRTITAAVLGVAGLALVLAASASPAPSGAAHARAMTLAHRTCFTGNLSWGVAQNQSSATTSLDTADSPPGCEQVLTRVLSTGGNTTRSGLIRNPGAATATVKDHTFVAKAWAEKQPNGDPGGRRCLQIFPNVEVTWHDCTG